MIRSGCSLVAALLLLPVLASPALAAEDGTAALYARKCSFCHGENGAGQTRKGRELKAPDFTNPRVQQRRTDAELRRAIEEGVPRTKMPGFKDKIAAADIESLVRYLRAFGGRRASGVPAAR